MDTIELDLTKAQPLFAYEWFGEYKDRPDLDEFTRYVMTRLAPEGAQVWRAQDCEQYESYGLATDFDRQLPDTHWTVGVVVYHLSFPMLEPCEGLTGNPKHTKRVEWPPNDA